MEESKGVEVGHIFMLQQGYAEKMKVSFLGPDGTAHIPWMGCYGVGTTRCIQAIVEQNFDDDGIKWPDSVAPFQYVIVPTTAIEDSPQMRVAEDLFRYLTARDAEVVFDDRSDRFGVKMKDALLIGYPEIIVVGRDAEKGLIEVQSRRNNERETISIEEFKSRFVDF